MVHEEEDLKSMSLGDHLEELRARLILALMGLFVGMVVCLFFGKILIGIMSAPFNTVISGLEKKGLVEKKHKGDKQELATNSQAVMVTYDADGGYHLYNSFEKIDTLLVQLHDLSATENDPNQPSSDKLDAPKEDNVPQQEQIAVIAQHPTKGFIVYVGQQQLDNLLAELVKSGAVVEAGKSNPAMAPRQRAVIVTHSPVEGFMVYMKTCILFGLLLSSPWVIWQIWSFVSAGLYRKERRYVRVVAPISAVLFITGALFFMLIVARLAMGFLVRFDAALGVQSFWSLQKYINMVFSLTLVFGVAFQTPIAIVFAEMLGLVTIEMLAVNRKYVILGLTIIAAVATPPDVISQIALAIPLYGLYEASILFCRIRRRRKPKSDNPYALTE